jgi:hypothetical protein
MSLKGPLFSIGAHLFLGESILRSTGRCRLRKLAWKLALKSEGLS